MSLSKIEATLTEGGWALERLSEQTLRAKFRAAGRVFRVFIHVDDLFATFAVIPFARLPEDMEKTSPLLKRLLRLNRQVNLARFSVDGDGDVVLSVEYKLADLDPSEIQDAVDVLSFYADKHYPEIAEMIGDPDDN